ncbi:WYL domain-containing protein [Enterococcus raffinosus]|uniref:WYL domain-containing protein n=1 Tax=Enterococcus raffinosus TaxID=71452 RepID=A0AAW8THT2_9ENTE|nr:WYL domain-containing protein [Enterococcus raffinosus]MDT2525622.1 WYL domain-containing protein [Enterococcus raffinosus]MDT2531854.1 WYL domain-containing protein [Enterococcus raffinosus]MDT2536154.1 WYL domain-containing protein [Enterococcus raffinosus]MDT2546647.1 WYL domain-containing protein [Enterococcus raffinosus]MDT2557009.1 WYL domain-containing protein [Enterococcus raffinosus]
MELFSEINSLYYQLMTKILQTVSLEQQQQLLEQNGFKETPFEMANYLKDSEESWHLLKEHQSILKKSPQPFPLTKLEKAWLAAIQRDPKFNCLGEDFDLETIEPLFDWQDYHYFDQFVSEDRFEKNYIKIIQQLLESIQEKKMVSLTYQSAKKRTSTEHLFLPLKLEYSTKNNKFRVLGRRKSNSSWKEVVFNCSNIQHVSPTKESFPNDIVQMNTELCYIVCELKDERSALERATFHFSNYRKTLERLDKSLYRMTIFYEKKDETELLINVLSFGARVKVIKPDHFVDLIKHRLLLQQHLIQKKSFINKKNVPNIE